jgi:hypothetical protein
MTGADLITQARRRVDALGSDTFTDAEVADYVNMSLLELHDLLINAYGDDFYSDTVTYALTASLNATVTLNPVPYKILRVDWLDNSDVWRPIRRVSLGGDRLTTEQKQWSQHEPTYRSRWSTLELYPPPSDAEQVRVHGIAMVPQLDTASPASYGVPGYILPWVQYVILGAAIHMIDRVEGDPSVLASQKVALATQIRNGKGIDTHGYQVITDVEGYWPSPTYDWWIH